MSVQLQCSGKNLSRLGSDWRLAPVLMGETVYIEATLKSGRKKQFLSIDRKDDNRLVYTPSSSNATAFVLVPEAQRLRDPIRREDLFYLRVAGSDSLYVHVAQPLFRRLINMWNNVQTFRNQKFLYIERDVKALFADLTKLKTEIENNKPLLDTMDLENFKSAVDSFKKLKPWTNDFKRSQFLETVDSVLTSLDSIVLQAQQANLGGDFLQLFAIDRNETGLGSGVPLKISAQPLMTRERSFKSNRFITYGQAVHLNAPVFRRNDAGDRDADIVCGPNGNQNTCQLFEDNQVYEKSSLPFSTDTFAFACDQFGGKRYFKVSQELNDSPLLGTPIDLDNSSVFDPLVDLPIIPQTEMNEVDDIIEQQVKIEQMEQSPAEKEQEIATAIFEAISNNPEIAQALLYKDATESTTKSASLSWWMWVLIGVAILAVIAAIVLAIIYFSRKNKSVATNTPSSKATGTSFNSDFE